MRYGFIGIDIPPSVCKSTPINFASNAAGRNRLSRWLTHSLVLLCLIFTQTIQSDVVAPAETTLWHPMQIDVIEPSLITDESADDINPFLDIALNVLFTAPDGRQFTVPGFYAGDGEGNGSGAVWRARFSPDSVGAWQYRVSFLSGLEIAVDDTTVSKALPNDGEQGNFEVVAAPTTAPGFLAHGRLNYVGQHYMQFADGTYWIKSGVDSPENLFGFAGFDGTVDQAGGLDESGLIDGLHHYAPHVADWREGDPDFVNSDTGVSGRGLIGAINYLASEGVNSVYFLPMNLGGDGRDTYPFVGASGTRFDNTHYDISKLHQWNIVLSHMQQMGVAAHIVLGEQEIGNTNWFDNGELGVERKLYYRELVARFSYLMAIKWNLSEESRFSPAQHLEFANYLRRLDWAQHPLSVHTRRNLPDERYAELLGSEVFEATSIQFSIENAGRFVEDWRMNSRDAGRPWIIDLDEVGPAGVGLTDTNADALRRDVLYPIYFSGGQLEWYFGYHTLPLGGDVRTEDFRTRESMYRYMRIAREFLQTLPFAEMEPADALFMSASEDPVEVFSTSGVYALYLPDSSVSGDLSVEEGTYDIVGFNPRTGVYGEIRRQQIETTLTIDSAQIDADLSQMLTVNNEAGTDWVVLLRKVSTTESELPDTQSTPGTESSGSAEVIDVMDAIDSSAQMPTTLPELAAAAPAPDVVQEQTPEQSVESSNLAGPDDSQSNPATAAAVSAAFPADFPASGSGGLSLHGLFVLMLLLMRKVAGRQDVLCKRPSKATA